MKVKPKVIFLLMAYSSLRPLLCLAAVELSVHPDVGVMPAGPQHTGARCSAELAGRAPGAGSLERSSFP